MQPRFERIHTRLAEFFGRGDARAAVATLVFRLPLVVACNALSAVLSMGCVCVALCAQTYLRAEFLPAGFAETCVCWHATVLALSGEHLRLSGDEHHVAVHRAFVRFYARTVTCTTVRTIQRPSAARLLALLAAVLLCQLDVAVFALFLIGVNFGWTGFAHVGQFCLMCFVAAIAETQFAGCVAMRVCTRWHVIRHTNNNELV